MNTKLKSIKEHLKQYAKYNKHYKKAYKEDQRNVEKINGWYTYPHTARAEVENIYNIFKTFGDSHIYRIQHIAYSLLRGKSLRQIENNIESKIIRRDINNGWEAYALYQGHLYIEKVKEYYNLFKPFGYPEFPDNISYDDRLTKSDGWILAGENNGE